MASGVIMATSVSKYIPSKTGIPRLTDVDIDNAYKRGWEQIPESEDIKRDLALVRIKKWSELTEDQRTGIYNHTLKYTTKQVCYYKVPEYSDKLDYVFQENIGTFTISYDGAKHWLSFNGTDLVSSPAWLTDKSTKQITWLKRFAQYLIDEPDELTAMICSKSSLPAYVNPAVYLIQDQESVPA